MQNFQAYKVIVTLEQTFLASKYNINLKQNFLTFIINMGSPTTMSRLILKMQHLLPRII